MRQEYNIGDWIVDLNVDDDGHLTVGINHKDETRVESMGMDIGTNEEEWVERFSTKGIETRYHEEIEHETSSKNNGKDDDVEDCFILGYD